MTYVSSSNNHRFIFKSGNFPLAASSMTNIFLTLNPSENYPTTFWYHCTGSKKESSIYPSWWYFYIALGKDNGSVEAQDYLNITQQIKNIAKNTDLMFGVQNIFDKTQKNLYMPLSQKRPRYSGLRTLFWMSLSINFRRAARKTRDIEFTQCLVFLSRKTLPDKHIP